MANINNEDLADEVAYFMLGSNMGDREVNLTTAIHKIIEQIGVVYAKSSIYETAAWGKTDQPSFLNQAVAVKSKEPALVLLNKILAIELQMGRVRAEKWGQRLIDIDLIFYANHIIDSEALKLPHPEMHKRKFVLMPLNEIAPNFIHPVLKKEISEILFTLNDELSIHKI